MKNMNSLSMDKLKVILLEIVTTLILQVLHFIKRTIN